jgi:hypothetical protein
MENSRATTLREKVTMFFLPPTVELSVGADAVEVGTLYNLRRELQACLFPGPIVDEADALDRAEGQRFRGIASAMVMFAGIDLLAKFSEVEKTPSGQAHAGWRFRRFLELFAEVDSQRVTRDEAKIVLAFRNAFMHSFSFHHIDENGNRVRLSMFWNVARAPVASVNPNELDMWQLNLDGLFEAFRTSILRYQERLDTDQELRAAFERAFDRYGSHFIAQGDVPQRH